ncbi:MAG: O-antigen ligase family protein [Candidatus Uhrbacteria bacterium]
MFALLIILFFLAFSALAWSNLRLACFFILATLPTYLIRFNLGSVPFTLLELMLLVVIIIWLFRFPGYKKLTKKFLIPMAIILLAATISIFVAPNLMTALGIWKAYFVEPILFYFVLTSILENKKNVRQAIYALGVGALFISLFAVFQKITGLALPVPWDLSRRLTSIFPYPNAVGLYLTPIIVFGSIILLQAIKKIKPFQIIFWSTTLFLSILAIIFSETEAAWVAIPTALWLLSWIPTKLRRWTIPGGVLVLLIIFAIPSISQPLIQKLTLQDYSGTIRQSQWSETVELIKDKPIFTAGLSGYPTAIKPYHQSTHVEIFQYPHNIFLNTWVETGLLGLIGLIGLMAEVIYLTVIYYRNQPKQHLLFLGCFGALLVIFIHGLVDVPYLKNDLAILTWSILAIFTTIEKT